MKVLFCVSALSMVEDSSQRSYIGEDESWIDAWNMTGHWIQYHHLTRYREQPLSSSLLHIFSCLFLASLPEPVLKTFMEPRNRSQGMNSVSLCSLAGRYDNPIPPRFQAPVDSWKIPALLYSASSLFLFPLLSVHSFAKILSMYPFFYLFILSSSVSFSSF